MTFDVWPTPIASDDLDGLPNDVDKVVEQKIRELESKGCAAADYRLSGEDVEHICIVILPRRHRMVIAFPAEEEVTILLVGPHNEADTAVDVYTRLYEVLGIDVPTDKRRKPACCTGAEPSVDGDLVDEFLERSKKLRLGRARRRRRSNRGRRGTGRRS
jgi:hypothetical protein